MAEGSQQVMVQHWRSRRGRKQWDPALLDLALALGKSLIDLRIIISFSLWDVQTLSVKIGTNEETSCRKISELAAFWVYS